MWRTAVMVLIDPTVHQLTCSHFQVTDFVRMPYQIPVVSDLLTVPGFCDSLDDASQWWQWIRWSKLPSETKNSNYFTFSPFSWNHLLFSAQSFFRFLRESFSYYSWFHLSRWGILFQDKIWRHCYFVDQSRNLELDWEFWNLRNNPFCVLGKKLSIQFSAWLHNRLMFAYCCPRNSKPFVPRL